MPGECRGPDRPDPGSGRSLRNWRECKLPQAISPSDSGKGRLQAGARVRRPGIPVSSQPSARFADDTCGYWLRDVHRGDASFGTFVVILAGGSYRGQSCSVSVPPRCVRIKGASRQQEPQSFPYFIGVSCGSTRSGQQQAYQEFILLDIAGTVRDFDVLRSPPDSRRGHFARRAPDLALQRMGENAGCGYRNGNRPRCRGLAEPDAAQLREISTRATWRWQIKLTARSPLNSKCASSACAPCGGPLGLLDK